MLLQGPLCDDDVNECAVYAGTDLGCQNGATCTNTVGSFTYVCLQVFLLVTKIKMVYDNACHLYPPPFIYGSLQGDSLANVLWIVLLRCLTVPRKCPA